MRPGTLSILAGGALLAVSGAAQAHHAVNAQFFVDQFVTKSGVLEKVEWINPHAYVHLVITENGKPVKYAMEWTGIAAMRRAGVTSKSMFKIGDTYKVTYNPSRNGSAKGQITAVQFPDGKKYETRLNDAVSGTTTAGGVRK
jgi:hypothetical protein